MNLVRRIDYTLEQENNPEETHPQLNAATCE
jgi:hypothetical protein